MTLIIEAEDTLSARPEQMIEPAFAPLRLGRRRRPPAEAAAATRPRPASRSSCGAVNWPSRNWGLVDAMIGAGAFALGHLLSPSFDPSHFNPYVAAAAAGTFAVSLLLASYIIGVYDGHTFSSLGRMAGAGLLSNLVALAATTLVLEWVGFVHVGRIALFDTFVLSTGGTFVCRMVARELARRSKVRVMFVGPPRQFRALRRELSRAYRDFYERPIWLPPAAAATPSERRALLLDAFHAQDPDEIVVMDHDPAVVDVLHNCQRILSGGCAIYTYAAYCERLLGELPVDSIDERGVLGNGFRVGSMHTGLVKRPMDIALAMFGLLVGSPLMLLCAIAVKLTSPGPVIYTQVRVGRYGKPFKILKFRTMWDGAEKGRAVWATAGDVRVTALGRFLRKTRFDELPQLWNILRGDMSLVGPRPERPEFVQDLRRRIEHYDLRHLVLPGLTGWAQIRFRYGASLEDTRRKLAYDLYYVRHCGLTFDLAICLRTLAAMARGAR
jgi:exopolysaccharide biosynthesis polyprenyl glycosylphosphotransferase